MLENHAKRTTNVGQFLCTHPFAPERRFPPADHPTEDMDIANLATTNVSRLN